MSFIAISLVIGGVQWGKGWDFLLAGLLFLLAALLVLPWWRIKWSVIWWILYLALGASVLCWIGTWLWLLLRPAPVPPNLVAHSFLAVANLFLLGHLVVLWCFRRAVRARQT